ncbi:MAG TPA: hypothetical protein VHU13_02595 [Solirubrobacteraceae bacterium]|nr:hypothetical protein [Solirubrobacteraceae bacterium]
MFEPLRSIPNDPAVRSAIAAYKAAPAKQQKERCARRRAAILDARVRVAPALPRRPEPSLRE